MWGRSRSRRKHSSRSSRLTSLVIQTAFLGDVVLTTPLLEGLARPAGPVAGVPTPAALPLVATHPAVRRAIPYDKRGQDRGMAAFVALARALGAERYEAAYLPHRSLRSGALAWLARIPRRVGFHDGWPLLYTEVRRRPADGHESDRLLALAGEAPHSFAPRLWPTLADAAAVDSWLDAVQGSLDGGFVALAPGSIWGAKRWPYYGELAEQLARRAGIVVGGGAGPASVGLVGLACRPCSDHGPRACPLGHHRCMRELSVDRVLAAIEETGALRRRD